MKRSQKIGLGFCSMCALLSLPFEYSMSRTNAQTNTQPNAQLSSGATSSWDGAISQITLSPDTRQIAFARRTALGSRIFVANIDGRNARMISQITREARRYDDVEPSWRSDGALIAFASNRSGNFDLFAVRPNGANLRAMTKTKTDERAPQWSPRAFGLFAPSDISERTVVGRSRGNVAPNDLQLLESLAKKDSGWEAYKYKFSIKPQARYYKLLFVEGRGESQKIATMRDNGGLRQILNTSMNGAHDSPRWDADAKTIAFMRRTPQGDAVYQADYPDTTDLNEDSSHPIFGVDWKEWRKSIKRLRLQTRSQGATSNLSISWTPNGEYLALLSGNSLRLVPRAASGLRDFVTPLRNAPRASVNFAWLRDGKTALVPVARGGKTLPIRVLVGAPLLDIRNIRDFAPEARDRSRLAQNGFVAAGAMRKQMFHIYEETDYENLPIFVSSDSLLHLNHLIFDYLLRGVETEHLAPTTIALIDHHLKASLAQRNSTSPEIRAAATRNAAFFAVAARLALGEVATGKLAPETVDADDALGKDRALMRQRTMRAQNALLQKWTTPLRATLQNLPTEINTQVAAELALIRKHNGMSNSPIFGGELSGVGDPSAPLIDERIDYSDFQPRGHYTRSEILRRYFLMTRWLSGAPFRRTNEGARSALLMLASTDATAQARHDKVNRVLEAFVGGADDDDMDAYRKIAVELWGSAETFGAIEDDAQVARFVERINLLPQPRIAASRGAAFRFFAQPYTADAEAMQNLIYDRAAPDVGSEAQPRYFALGLDVMGVLGSDRARQILDNTSFQGAFFDFGLNESQYENYDRQFRNERQKFAAFKLADWNKSLYTRTLYSILPLLKPSPNSRFKFTQSAAWTDKNLNTALATWAELKHDTMPKQPVAIETGGEGGLTEAPLWDQPRGFVEPSPQVIERLQNMVAAESRVLEVAGYLSADRKQRLKTFASLLQMLSVLERKQNTNVPLSPREVEQLRFYGAYQEHLTLVTAEGEGGSMEGNDMAIIADVASAFSTRLQKLLALQEGVGRALPIYVAVERNGHRELTRGAVFTYYEFAHPAEDRLTDEKWRTLLDGENAPQLPNWTSSFISRTKDAD